MSGAPEPEALVSRLTILFADKEQYRQLLTLQGVNAQKLLDLFQGLLDTPGLDAGFRRNLIVATQRLSNKYGLYPACYELKGVRYSGDPVAAGSFADIYKGSFRGQVVSLKVLRMYQTSRIEYFLKRCAKEAVLRGQLSHPNVLAIYGLYRLQSRICLVSLWMEHGDLNHYLGKRPNVDRPLIVSDVAQGVLYLHSNGIIHGDLKAANVLVSSFGRAHLADFDLSSVSDANILAWTSNSSVASKGGSVRWQAPELFDFDSDEVMYNSNASDIYAWACVCYEASICFPLPSNEKIFAGVIPFAHLPRDFTVMLQVKNGATPLRPPESSEAWGPWGLTEPIWTLMTHCWNAVPSERPTIIQVVNLLAPHLGSDTRPNTQGDILSPAQFRKEMNDSNIVTVETLENLTGVHSPSIHSQPEDVSRLLLYPQQSSRTIVGPLSGPSLSHEGRGISTPALFQDQPSGNLDISYSTPTLTTLESPTKLLSASFNQDFSKGYAIVNAYPFGRLLETNGDEPNSIVEMLFSTSLVAIVGSSSARKLQMANIKRRTFVCELLFPSPILAVKLNRKTIIAVLEGAIYLYDLSNMKLLHTIESLDNPKALVALSPSIDNLYLAYPTPPSSQAKQLSGEITLFSTKSLTSINVIKAHETPVSSLSFNISGTLLATASGKEATVHVWSVPKAELLYQFRYGAREAEIYSMNFKPTNPATATKSITKGLTAWGRYLPTVLTDVLTVNCFAYLYLPTKGARCHVALLNETYVMVASMEGTFDMYKIDTEKGGECLGTLHYRLLDSGKKRV